MTLGRAAWGGAMATVLAVLAASCGKPAPQGRRILYYHDPMHPSYRSDKPGIAPDCHMQLTPVYADEVPEDRAIRLTAEQEKAIGLETVEARPEARRRTLRVLGRVEVEESRTYRVSGGQDGWVKQVFGGETGSRVKRGQTLASFYNRDLLSTQQGYIYALDSYDRVRKNPAHTAEQEALARRQLDVTGDTLGFLGMGPEQMAELARTRHEDLEIVLSSPVDGVVLSRRAAAGMRFERGQDLFEVADVGKVWVEAEVYLQDAEAAGAARRVTASIPGAPGAIELRRTASLPQYPDPSGLTKLRLEADNPETRLLPGMALAVTFEIDSPDGLAVPEQAVLDSGAGARVWVRRGDGGFEAREVAVGWRSAGMVQVTGGLKAGERVAATGAFLLDSESRLHAEPQQP
jgi:membrane fusion protein, copper/silver efflux system